MSYFGSFVALSPAKVIVEPIPVLLKQFYGNFLILSLHESFLDLLLDIFSEYSLCLLLTHFLILVSTSLLGITRDCSGPIYGVHYPYVAHSSVTLFLSASTFSYIDQLILLRPHGK